MSFYQLFAYDQVHWTNFSTRLNDAEFDSLDDFRKFMSDEMSVGDQKTVDALVDHFGESVLTKVFNDVRKFALKLPDLVPTGKIQRLTLEHPLVEFTRSQVIGILCHMCLCSLKKSHKNVYWVTFENWLTDGRTCAIVYLRTLIEYFMQTFAAIANKNDEFMKEIVSFSRFSANIVKLTVSLQDPSVKMGKIDLKLHGGIGDDSLNEVDFANCDIGYGVTGTQEEILFGASPEMCVAMLFCDTMQDDEAILIRGARQIAFYDGYGMTLKFKSLVPIDQKPWTKRVVIAVDAMDFSAYSSSFHMQIEKKSLERELRKLFAAYSEISLESIDTGHWGCGAFCGNRCIKSVIQLVASSITSNRLVYFCHGDTVFYENFSSFLHFLHSEQISIAKLWYSLSSPLNEDENVFEQLTKILQK